MNIPKVEFSVAPRDQVFSLIHYFLNPAKNKWDWSNTIYESYPELKSKLQNIKDMKKRKEVEYRFFYRGFPKRKNRIRKKGKSFPKRME